MRFDIEINADASLLGVFPVVLSKAPSHMVCLVPVKLLLQKQDRVSLTHLEQGRKNFKAAFSLRLSYRHIVSKLIARRQRMIITLY